MAGDRCQVYKALCEFLIQGWQTLGISLNYGDQKCNYNHHASCFHTYTRADLVTPEGYKLIGSAQLRRKQAILQHGSIRLHPDPQFYAQIFGEELIIPVEFFRFSQLDVIQSLCQSFGDRPQVILQEKPLSSDEWQQIYELKSHQKTIKT
jgi:lipoate-protein ligase A